MLSFQNVPLPICKVERKIKNHNKEAWENLNLKTKYYNSDIHKGAFMLPQYVKDMLNENE